MRFYLRRLESGRDFARADPVARQMVNLAYLVGDRDTGQAVVVDPAYAVDDLLDAAGDDGMRVVGAVATHYHADHVGGDLMGTPVEGITALLERLDIPIHAQRVELEWIRRATGVGEPELVGHESDDVLTVGGLPIRLLGTPGHTPGSQCLLAEGRLLSGDTLFLEGCGRTDLPGGDADALAGSLRRLAELPDDTVVHPGHHYSVPTMGTLAAVKEINAVYRRP